MNGFAAGAHADNLRADPMMGVYGEETNEVLARLRRKLDEIDENTDCQTEFFDPTEIEICKRIQGSATVWDDKTCNKYEHQCKEAGMNDLILGRNTQAVKDFKESKCELRDSCTGEFVRDDVIQMVTGYDDSKDVKEYLEQFCESQPLFG